MQIDISKIKFDSRGLVPAVVVDVRTNDVVMLAYMNEESLLKTLETGYTWFWSRSRQELWNKGATSGNLQKVVELFYDCDGDALLVKVEQPWPAIQVNTPASIIRCGTRQICLCRRSKDCRELSASCIA